MTEFVSAARAMRQRGELFDREQPIHIARSPGRLDLMGGNDDYTGGLVFEATIREATWAAAQQRQDRTIVLSNPQMAALGWRDRVTFTLDELTDEDTVRRLVGGDESVRWTAYVLGLFYWLKQHHPEQVERGMNVLVQSDVPLNKGVSSSAAVEVAVMKAAAHAYGVDLAGVALAQACQWAENVIAQSACGIMDQIAVISGDEGCVLPLVCQPCNPLPLVHLPAGLTYWGIDSGVSHQVSGIEYEAARAAGFMGYKLICDREGLPVTLDASSSIARWTDPRWNGYLANMSPSVFRTFENELPTAMSGQEYLNAAGIHVDPYTQARPDVVYRVRACTRYAVEENYRVQLFVELLRGLGAGENLEGAMLMGELMHQSHWAYTDTGLGCQETDLLVELARRQGPQRGIFGAKVTGGGGGGTVAVLGRAGADDALSEIVEQYRAETGVAPYVFRGSSMGADRFGIATLEP